ncbi:GNAT family N-acetyltransferase [Streptomyces sp. NBC_01005]|uniref:GNAT family N-acetyltransferase n=1 Tax=unclassified Streptomyces TaxID=2593676 RepID=UPI003870C5AA|nr:GNAT family N-acetyltransferase [Streptomyces sp. NBC_01005]WTC92686.1 GNAT family N-acetyltransferase [Streptomyces sp. NBC_01650]
MEETSSAALVGGMTALPATWAFTHPMLIGSPNAHIIAGLVACLDSLAVVDQWRGKGIARALVAEAEKAAGSNPDGKLSAAVLYATHEPELTDFYAGLGFTLSPDGIGIPTPAGLICHGPTKGFRFSVKPLRTGVQLEPMPTPYDGSWSSVASCPSLRADFLWPPFPPWAGRAATTASSATSTGPTPTPPKPSPPSKPAASKPSSTVP